MTQLLHIHAAIANLLYTHGGIPRSAVELRFERPTREWRDTLSRPTLNFALFELDESAEFRNATPRTIYEANRARTRMAPRRFDLRYLVTAVSSEPAEEHLLIWRALAALLKYPVLPEETLPGPLRELGIPVGGRVGRSENGPRPADLTSALDMALQPALIYTVTAPLDLEIELDAPLVLGRELHTHTTPSELRIRDAPSELRSDLFGTVRSSNGNVIPNAKIGVENRSISVTTDTVGRFNFPGVSAGPALLWVEHDSVRYAPIGIEHMHSDELPTQRLLIRAAPASGHTPMAIVVPTDALEIVIEA